VHSDHHVFGLLFSRLAVVSFQSHERRQNEPTGRKVGDVVPNPLLLLQGRVLDDVLGVGLVRGGICERRSRPR